jgi:4'-phosphopantetheinyl transferase
VTAAEFFNNLWPLPHDAVELNDDEVHVWLVNAGAKDIPQDGLATSLSEDEKERAARFKFAKDRRLYVAGHAALRSLLADYLRVAADTIHFVSGPHGKPAIASPLAGGGLEFNLSHSHEVALVAVARQRAVGVDVEFVKREFSFDDLARRFFTTKEVAALFELPQPLQCEAFFKCWTSKEAFLKAKGTGLSGKLDEVGITLAADQQVRINASVPGWSLTELALCVGYQAALVVQGDPRPIRCYQWESPLMAIRR